MAETGPIDGGPIDSGSTSGGPQKRFWNWQDEDSTFELSQWRMGIIDAGLYRGFDGPRIFPATMNLVLNHSTTGAVRTNIDRTLSGNFGVVITKQGVLIRQERSVVVAIEPSVNARMDAIIVEHEYKEILGGIDAQFKVIKGTNENPPALTNPNIQVVLGYLYLPAGTTRLNKTGVKYIRAKQPTFAASAEFIEKSNGFFLTSLDGRGNKIINLGDPVNNQDAATKYYVDQAIGNNVRVATEEERGIIEIADENEVAGGVDNQRAMTPYKTKKSLDARIATQPETNGDVESEKFVTPKTLGNRTATQDRRGIIKIATDAEAADPANNSVAITPYYLNKIGEVTPKVVEIGNWNMAADGVKNIAHTYDWWNKVVGIDVVIVGDNDTRETLHNPSGQDVTITANTISVNGNTGFYTGSNYDSVARNRGYVIFFVKNDIVQPPSTIGVNAGVDQSGSFRLLQWGTPVLNSVEVIPPSSGTYAGGYPSSLPYLRMNITNGIGNSSGSFQIYAKRKNPSGTSAWNNWNSFGSDLKGYIVDTGASSYMDGQYYIKVVCNLFGMQLESNVVEVNLRDNGGSAIGTKWNAPAGVVSTTSRQLWQLAGSIESIGSPISSALWTVVSKPDGANATFGAASNQVTSFFGDKFGVYELKLSGANAAAQTADDTVLITINQIDNVAPTAIARWSAASADPILNVTWQVYNPATTQWNGYYNASLYAGASSDPDGYIVGYHWQFRYADGDWQDMTADAASFPNAVYVNKQIQGDGQWKFRVRAKDNLGAISNWSEETTLNITGSTTTVTPLNTFTISYLAGSNGSGSFHNYMQLTINPVNNVAKLVLEVVSYTHGNVAVEQTNDFYIKVQGNGIRQYYVIKQQVPLLTSWDITPIIASSMLLWIDLNNTPPYKMAQVNLKAYDAANNLIGIQPIYMGHM